MFDPNYYIALCARKYAEATERLASTKDARAQDELKALLVYLRDSAVHESEGRRGALFQRLPEDLRRWADRKAEVMRTLTRSEAELLRSWYAIPGGGLLGTLSSTEMMHLADLYEGWSCTSNLEVLAAIQCQGMADGIRLMADFLGPNHQPHDPPARSINRFMYDRTFGVAGQKSLHKASQSELLNCLEREELPRTAKAHFRPSFDPEALLCVRADSEGTTIEVTSAEHTFAHPFAHRSVVPPHRADRFWTKLDTILGARFEVEATAGLDGTTIKVDCRTPAGSANFEVWSPEPTTYAGRLVGLIYDVAQEVASSNPLVAKCLERLRR